MKHILFSLFVVMLFTNCEKEVIEENFVIVDHSYPRAEDTIYMSEELKSYFLFEEGSWWIYKRTDTNVAIYDTATLVRKTDFVYYERIYAPTAWQKVGAAVEHTYYPSCSNCVSPYISVGMGNGSGLVDRISLGSNNILLNYLPDFFSIPIDSSLIYYKSNGRSKLLDTFNLITNNFSFSNTVHLKYGALNSEVWITKNTGLTKYFNGEDNTSWELIDYEIKK